MAVLGVCCCSGFSLIVPLSSGSAWASYCGTFAAGLGLQSTSSIVVARRLSCSAARGIFLDQ